MRTVKNIIIGAGPAGLQLGYYFEKAGLDYLILERSSGVASFFGTYPLSGKLISINKPNTGSDDAEFNLRHDWNSLLSDGLVFPRNYSNEYYPDNTDLVRYMTDFASKNTLKIQFNTEVKSVMPGYMLECVTDGVSVTYTCEKLIIATGLSKPVMPPFPGKTAVPPKHYSEFSKDHFKKSEILETYRNKSLLLIGNGNGAFELGNLLNPYCSSVTIYGRSVKAWSASTHYTGDLRSVYLSFLDTFLLKSQNAINVDSFKIMIDQEEGG
jgi:cation diffusion facilitator CzcD-associated flavoprotein CzcO